MKFLQATLLLGGFFSLSLTASAQFYNESAGQNIIYKDYKEYAAPQAALGKASSDSGNTGTVVNGGTSRSTVTFESEETKAKLREANKGVKVEQRIDEKTGETKTVVVERAKVETDSYGNAVGNQFDLAVDGAFKGRTVAVLQFYDFPFEAPKKALEEKGFSVYRWIGNPPSAAELREKLKHACQLWIISDSRQKLSAEHLEVIKDFFNSGRGLYIWGDNDPYYADANYIGSALLDITMSGDLPGAQTVNLKEDNTISGIRQNHLITTGMNFVYEGITIATVAANEHLTPLVWGSAGNLVTAVYEQDGKRAIFDGGFTRLYNGWDTAGTGRYVKNAAAWLANPEKFGEEWKEEGK